MGSRTTPKTVKALKAGEIFVFGSNVQGAHAGGAARTAVKKFGAVEGQGEGLQGQSYAIPTMEGLQALGAAVDRFLVFAAGRADLTFLVTAVGTGIAGHPVADVALLFAGRTDNVILPAEFLAAAEPTIISYKGFGDDWKCRDMQYAVGGEYVHAGEVKACAGGFHACEYPLDVFRYYPPAGSRFAVVEQSGQLARHHEDSKVASSKIKIKAELTLAGIIKAAIEYTIARSKPEGPSATGVSGAASATGDSGAASATGVRGAASATGVSGAASATGDSGAASATGYSGAASATGVRGAASATGVRGAASATGVSGAAMASGYNGRVRGADGNALFLVERSEDWQILAVWAGIAGRDGIKADTWYRLEGGKPVEVAA